jgi:hypothetical protein
MANEKNDFPHQPAREKEISRPTSRGIATHKAAPAEGL